MTNKKLECLICGLGLIIAASSMGAVAASSDDKAALADALPLLPQPAQELVVREQETQLTLPESLLKIIKKKKVAEDEISIFVRDVNASAPLLLYQAETPRNPASTMKVVTTWGALKTLGPAWTWDTEAWLRGQLDGDVLNGDLILKGYGDPFLVHETLWQFVHDLRLKGIREISGDIILDGSFFDVPKVDPGAFDNQPTRVYNAPPSALMFNFQATRFLLSPDAAAQKVRVTTLPLMSQAIIDNQLELIEGRCRRKHAKPIISLRSGGKLLVKGKFATGCGQKQIHRLVSKPGQHLFDAFKQTWTSLGGYLGGNLKAGVVRKGDKRFHVHTSRPLGEQVRLINKWSNNVMTRQLLLSLGARQYGAPATLEKGRLAIMDVLREQGLPTANVIVDNGSGLSRDTRISAAQLGQLLQAIWYDPYMPELLNSLPLLGEDGTLARRFRNSELKGRSRLKTGTLNKVTAIAGYMLTRSGKRMVVVMLHNGKKAGSAGRALQNELLEWVFEQ